LADVVFSRLKCSHSSGTFHLLFRRSKISIVSVALSLSTILLGFVSVPVRDFHVFMLPGLSSSLQIARGDYALSKNTANDILAVFGEFRQVYLSRLLNSLWKKRAVSKQSRAFSLLGSTWSACVSKEIVLSKSRSFK